VEICKIQEIIAKTEEQELKVIGSDDQGFIDEVDEMPIMGGRGKETVVMQSIKSIEDA